MNQQDTKEKECDEYWHAVNETAESIVAEFMDNDDGQDQHELLQSLVSESCDQHGYVICDDLSIHTLLYSQNACAGFFNGTFAPSQYASDAPFPFSTLAGAAFEIDVAYRVQRLLENEMTPGPTSDNNSNP